MRDTKHVIKLQLLINIFRFNNDLKFFQYFCTTHNQNSDVEKNHGDIMLRLLISNGWCDGDSSVKYHIFNYIIIILLYFKNNINY